MVCDRNDYCRLKAVTNNKFSLYSKIKKKSYLVTVDSEPLKKKREIVFLLPGDPQECIYMYVDIWKDIFRLLKYKTWTIST